MNRLFALAAIGVVISFASCGKQSGAEVATEDSLRIDTVATLDQTQTIENVAASLMANLEKGDAVVVKKIIEEVKEQIQLLVETGDEETAVLYVAKVQEFVEGNQDKLQEITSGGAVTVDDIMKVVKDLSVAAGQEVDAVVETDEKTMNEVENKVDETIEKAQNQVREKVDAAISDATNNAKKQLGI